MVSRVPPAMPPIAGEIESKSNLYEKATLVVVVVAFLADPKFFRYNLKL